MDAIAEAYAKTSRHKCLIYEGHPSEQLPVIVPLLIEGLKNKRRCLYLGDPETIAMVGSGLAKAGVDVDGETGRTALIMSSDRAHLEGGSFDPQAMVDDLRNMIDRAVRDGFSGLTATGDMMWELGTEKNFDRLLEYEALLEAVFPEKPLNGICQYRRDILPARALRDAVLTHQSLYAGEDLLPDNLFYIPPEILLQNPGPAARDKQGEWMWQQIDRIARAEAERDRAMTNLKQSEETQRRLAEMLAQANEDLEARVESRTSELKAVNLELEAFSYSVSHDLRAPLRAIGGFTQNILETHGQELAQEAREDFDRVLVSAKRMGELIDGLLVLARVSRGDLLSQDIDLSAEATAVIKDLRQSDPGRSVEAVIAPGLRARGDSRLLSVVLANLLGNAWKYTSKTPAAKIGFGSVEEGGRRTFFVRDNGAGFNPSFQNKLFAPFQRLHSAAEFPGTGIGLATVARILRRHGGDIRAESTPGQGAAFYFHIPDRPL